MGTRTTKSSRLGKSEACIGFLRNAPLSFFPYDCPPDQGIFYTARILAREDLNRQLVKSQTCTVVIPEYELTIPAHRGQLTTVEGLLRDTTKDLAAGQPLRRLEDEAAYNKIQRMLDAFEEVLADDTDDGDMQDNQENERPKPAEKLIVPFTVQLDDPAGDSFIEFFGSISDPKWNMRQYTRTKEQNITLGLATHEDPLIGDTQVFNNPSHKEPAALVDEIEAEEIFVFPGVCSSCGRPLDTLMKKMAIPFFKVCRLHFCVTAKKVDILVLPRISSSFLPIVSIVDTETMK